jgi:hypothetical protein
MPESFQAETQLCLIIKIVLCEKLGNRRLKWLGRRPAWLLKPSAATEMTGPNASRGEWGVPEISDFFSELRIMADLSYFLLMFNLFHEKKTQRRMPEVGNRKFGSRTS